MYIFISSDFAMQARALAFESKENFSEFKEGCFSEIEVDGDRVTFLGHGEIKEDRVIFGDSEFSPKQFVDHLIKYNIPTSIKTIDLIGCYLGLSQDKRTFLEETVKELHAHEKYRHIKVRGFIHDDKEKKYVNMSMTFSSSELGRIENIVCVLFTHDQYAARQIYDDAVAGEHKRSSRIQSQLNFKQDKISNNEKLEQEIAQLKANKKNGIAIDDFDLIEREEALLTDKEISKLTQEITDLAKELKAVTQKKREAYEVYKKTFESYGEPTITHDIPVKKIREHLDKDICDPEISLSVKMDSKHEKEKGKKYLRNIIKQSVDLLEIKYSDFNEQITTLMHENNGSLEAFKASLEEFKKLTKEHMELIESNEEKIMVLDALISKTSYANQGAIHFLRNAKKEYYPAAASSSSASSIKPSVQIDPADEIYVGRLGDHEIEFKLQPISGENTDCGFLAFDVTREAFVNVLLDRSASSSTREELAEEVNEFISENNGIEFLETLISDTDYQLLMSVRKAKLARDVSSGTASEDSDAQKYRELLCSREVYEAYVRCYRVDKTGYKLMMGFEAAKLYAQYNPHKKVSLYLWKKKKGQDKEVSCIKQHEIKDSPIMGSSSLHMLHTRSSTHFDVLLPQSIRSLTPSLSQSAVPSTPKTEGTEVDSKDHKHLSSASSSTAGMLSSLATTLPPIKVQVQQSSQDQSQQPSIEDERAELKAAERTLWLSTEAKSLIDRATGCIDSLYPISIRSTEANKEREMLVRYKMNFTPTEASVGELRSWVNTLEARLAQKQKEASRPVQTGSEPFRRQSHS